MTQMIMTGDQAIARGAIEADVRIVTGYPGSPGTKVLACIMDLIGDDLDRHVEWSVNEKVAFEMALGASIGGDRAMVCLKSVGMNITIDPIMTANLTGVNAGLVILLGDDPGALLSQNEQDTRLMMDMLELPLIEPATPQEAKDMVVSAFDISEEFQTVVVVREIRSFSVMKGSVELAEEPKAKASKGYIKGKDRWVSTTFNVLDNHRKLHAKLDLISRRFEKSPFNRIIGANRHHCIITAGFSYTKLMNVLASIDPSHEKFAVLKLGTISPLPEALIADFLRDATHVLVIEDNEPYIESKVKALAHKAHLSAEVVGKTTGHLSREGELSGEDIERVLRTGIAGSPPGIKPKSLETDSLETLRTFCDGCPYTPTFEILSQVIDELGEKPVIIAEPGCAVRVNNPPFEMLDVKYSMGSAIGIASGLAWSRAKVKPIAICGDSSFFHTGINALMNVVANRANIFIMVLDNSVTALTGYQPHPGTGYDGRGRKTTAVDIADIARSCHVPFVAVTTPDDPTAMKSAFRRAMTSNELSLVIVRKPCPLAKLKQV